MKKAAPCEGAAGEEGDCKCRIKDDSYARREVREVKTNAKSLSLLHISKKSCIFAAEIGVL